MKKYTCPFDNQCSSEGYTERELYDHCPRAHGRTNACLVCPICAHEKNEHYERGSAPYGFFSHLLNKHAPPNVIEEMRLRGKHSQMPTYSFALVVCRHPITKKYLLVEEGSDVGWWLPGGRVDPGEHFVEAAVRETLEEGGIDVELRGVLKVEYRAYDKGGARQRIIFYAEPKDINQKPKDFSDYESNGAEWVGFNEMIQDLDSKKKRLRADEPLIWFRYVEEGGTIHPMDLIGYRA
ncbi:8-oxo-dGDP phosphatase [Acrasis kona]|uniref:8-oxo-dGDP phosphatase n=1 Tax=Acrasis kona TaxID=1008807 RepID=A0AAW2ZRT8_9EUKA